MPYTPFKVGKSLIIGLTVFLIFTSTEVLLRVRQFMRNGTFFNEEGVLYRRDPVLEKVLRPGVKIVGSSAALSIDEWGFRGPDFPREKANGVFRIFVLGDSVVFERFAINNGTTWTARLEKTLNSSQTGKKVEVINAGIPGFKIDSAYCYLKDRVSGFKPDMVILYQGANDINYQSQIAHSSGRPEANEADLLDFQRIGEKYFLWLDLLRSKTAAFLASGQRSLRSDRIDSASVDNYENGLRKIIDYCRKNGIILIPSTVARSFRRSQPEWYQMQMSSSMMVYNPYLSVKGLNDAFDRFNGAVRDLSREQGLDLVDADAEVPSTEKYFRDHVHFTDAGDRLVARIFARKILKRINQVPTP